MKRYAAIVWLAAALVGAQAWGQAVTKRVETIERLGGAGPVFNVTDPRYGAKTDGTDATTAFQAAFDAAGAVGGTVFIPRGTYTFDTSQNPGPHVLTLTGSHSGITIKCEGTLKLADEHASAGGATKIGMLYIDSSVDGDVSDIVIDGLHIDCNEAGQVAPLVDVNGISFNEGGPTNKVEYVTFKNCLIENGFNGINVEGNYIRQANNTVRNCAGGFGWTNDDFANIERYYEGVNLRAVDCTSFGFDWSGGASTKTANGTFANLTAINCGQNKTAGPWYLTIQGMIVDTTTAGPGMSFGAQQRGSSLTGFIAFNTYSEAIQFSGAITDAPAYVKDAWLYNCGTNSTVSINAGTANCIVENVYIDGNDTIQRGISTGGGTRHIFRGITVVDCLGTSGNYPVQVSSVGGIFEDIKITGASGSYCAIANGAGQVWRNLSGDLPILVNANNVAIEDSDLDSMSTAPAQNVVWSSTASDRKIRLVNVRNARLDTDFTGGITLAPGAVEAVTATAGGAAIAHTTDRVTVTSTDATHAVVLPFPSVGRVITGYVGSNGFEMWATGSSVTINGVVCSATNEAAIPADSLWRAECVSSTAWILTYTTSAGAAGSTITPDPR